MARSTSGIAGNNSSLVDGELDRFFLKARSAYRSRVGVRISRASRACRRFRLASPHAHYATQMGVDPASDRAVALHDSGSWTFSVEFSLAAILSLGSGRLRGRSAAIFPTFAKAVVSDPGCSSTWFGDFDRDCNFDLPYRRELRISISLDSYRTRCALVPLGIFATEFRISSVGARGDHVFGVACNISLHPDELRCSKVQFFSRTT